MPFTYDQLQLGDHPFSMEKDDREKQKEILEEQKKQLEEEMRIFKEKQIEEQAFKRLKHQIHLLNQRMFLIDATNASEANLKIMQELLPFTVDVKFSPELRTALLKYARSVVHNAKTGMSVAQSYGYMQAQVNRMGHKDSKLSDLRDLADMIQTPSDASEKEIYENAWMFSEDYFCGDPALRKARLDEFYDWMDSINPVNLDLSCLFGKDRGKRSGPSQLTNSERDFMKLIMLSRGNQAIQTKGFENPQYMKERYPTRKAKVRHELLHDLLMTGGFVSYLTSGLLANNDITAAYTEFPKDMGAEGMCPSSCLAPQVAFQAYRQQYAALNGETCDMSVRFQIPKAAAKELYEYSRPAEKGGQGNVDEFHFDRTLGLYYSTQTAQKAMKVSGLDVGDLVFIDGESLKEKFRRENPSFEGDVTKAIKDAAMKAVMSGEHRVELATLHWNDKESYSLHLHQVEPDLHGLDEWERANEHPAKRGFFGMMKKLPTRADRIDQLWAKDPDKKARQGKIEAHVHKKLIEAINRKEDEKHMGIKLTWHEFEELAEPHEKFVKKPIEHEMEKQAEITKEFVKTMKKKELNETLEMN